MAHLGHLLTALADGQLSPAVTEKVLEHVAVCRPCAAELAAERRARRLLAESAATEVPADLAARLRTIAAQPVAEPAAPRAPQRRTAALTAVGSLVGVCAVAGALFVAGSPREAAPVLSDAAALSSIGTVPDVPRTTALAASATLRTAHAASPLPEVFTLTRGRSLRGGGQVLELAGRGGHVVLVTQPGRLDPAAVAAYEASEHAGARVHVLGDEPFHAVWQSGQTVVELVTDLPEAQVTELVAHFPAEDYDDGPLARLARGWTAAIGGARR